MVYYNKTAVQNALSHAGKKGMKWGFNDGQKNGKRTASNDVTDSFQITNGNMPDHYSDNYKREKERKEREQWDEYHGITAEKVETLVEDAKEAIEAGKAFVDWMVGGAKKAAKIIDDTNKFYDGKPSKGNRNF